MDNTKMYAGLDEINEVLTLRNVNGRVKVVGFKADYMYTQSIYVQKDTTIQGNCNILAPVLTPMQIPPGSLEAPSLSFSTASGTGLYQTTTGLGFANAGVCLVEIEPAGVSFHVPVNLQNLTQDTINVNTITSDGDLLLRPAGNIDCGGKSLINVGSVATNPDYYTMNGKCISTDVTPANIININTVNDTLGIITYEIVCVNTTDAGSDFASFKGVIKYKNIAGAVSTNPNYETTMYVEPSLTNAKIQVAINNAIIQVQVIGVVGKNINWSGAARVNIVHL